MPNPYLRLMRLHQPTGIWLLLWPCWWSLALSSHGYPDLKLLILFGIGAVLMRSAGCIVNDLADRKVDARVARTRTRPLASGEVMVKQAAALLGALLAASLVIALQMNHLVLGLAAGSLALVATYPFMKRITYWPQAFLGLTFNWGALMAWAAVKDDIGLPALLLYLGGIFWTLGYDTIYAHQDIEDDRKVGVKSTALRFGAATKYWVAGFYTLAVLLWALAGWFSYVPPAYFLGMLFVAAHLSWQVLSVRLNDPASCLKVFRSNATLGGIFFAGTGAINAVWHKIAGWVS